VSRELPIFQVTPPVTPWKKPNYPSGGNYPQFKNHCAKEWGVQVNVQKTKCQVFRRGGRLAGHESWSYDNKQIEIVNQFKYLGVTFSTKHGWNNHTKLSAEKAKKVIFLLRRITHGVAKLPLPFLWHLYDMLVSPVVLYGSEVLGCHANNLILDGVEAKYARQILDLPTGCPHSPIFLDLERYWTVFWKAKLRPILYLIKLSSMPPDKLAYQALLIQKEMATNGVQCWATEVNTFLNTINVPVPWDDLHQINNPDWINSVKERVSYHSKMEALVEAMDRPSLKHYVDQWREPERSQEVVPKEILRLPSLQRKLLLSFRYNLPTLKEKITVDGNSSWRCSLCGNHVDCIWTHLYTECQRSLVLRSAQMTDAESCLALPFSATHEVLTQHGQFLTKLFKALQRKKKAFLANDVGNTTS